MKGYARRVGLDPASCARASLRHANRRWAAPLEAQTGFRLVAEIPGLSSDAGGAVVRRAGVDSPPTATAGTRPAAICCRQPVWTASAGRQPILRHRSQTGRVRAFADSQRQWRQPRRNWMPSRSCKAWRGSPARGAVARTGAERSSHTFGTDGRNTRSAQPAMSGQASTGRRRQPRRMPPRPLPPGRSCCVIRHAAPSASRLTRYLLRWISKRAREGGWTADDSSRIGFATAHGSGRARRASSAVGRLARNRS